MTQPESKDRDLSAEVKELKAQRTNSAYDERTRLGGRFTLIYPIFIGAILLFAYLWSRKSGS